MSRIDQFESFFKAATRTPFHYKRVEVSKVLVVSDLGDKDARELTGRLQSMLRVLGDEATWVNAAEDRGRTVRELLEVVEEEKADLIVTYRSLYSECWRWPYSLGEHLDVLTQAATTPVLVLPRPDREAFWQQDGLDTSSVMAITDHLNGDDRLVHWAARFTGEEGLLTLVHVENETAFERVIDAISKIPAIDSELARELIGRQLLKDPAAYIETCREVLAKEGLRLSVEAVTEFGHRLGDVQRLVEERTVDLLVMETKDDDQLAMHGLAFPIAIELRETPLLML